MLISFQLAVRTGALATGNAASKLGSMPVCALEDGQALIAQSPLRWSALITSITTTVRLYLKIFEIDL